jgi:hypothetical protein
MPLETLRDRAADLVFEFKRALMGPYRARRVQLFGVGTGKSGTHSIAEMFSKNVRAQHEPEAPKLINKIVDHHQGRISTPEWFEWLRARDRRLALEVDSSNLNSDLLDFLVPEFPRARFVLTIRDCYSWFNSQINHTLRSRPNQDQDPYYPHWLKIEELRRGPSAFDYAPEEQVLKDHGIACLNSGFARWTTRNQIVLDKVPAERLLVVRTDQITPRAFEIAEFAGLPRRAIRPDRRHAFENPVKQELIRQIDRAFLEEKVERHCRPLMARYFPEIKSLDDSKL